MARLLLLLIIAISGCTRASAQSMLRIRLADNSPITVSVDGRYFNKRGTSITVGDLPPGSHVIRIFKDPQYRSYQEVLYRGRVRTTYGMITHFMYDPYSGDVRVRQEDMDNTGNGTGDGSRYRYSEDNDYRDDYRNDENHRSSAQNPGHQPGRIAQGRHDDYIPDNSNEQARPNNKPLASPVTVEGGTLNDAETSKVKAKVKAKATDTEKLKLLKDLVANEKLTTFQVSVMMDWLSFESSRLDFAKWAYERTIDKDNYADLSAKFGYSDSKEELSRFLQSR